MLARQALSLDQLSGGRLDLGIGSGSFLPEFDAFGFDRLDGAARSGGSTRRFRSFGRFGLGNG